MAGSIAAATEAGPSSSDDKDVFLNVTTASGFQHLLGLLREAHEQELASLQAEVTTLRQQLLIAGGAVSCSSNGHGAAARVHLWYEEQPVPEPRAQTIAALNKSTAFEKSSLAEVSLSIASKEQALSIRKSADTDKAENADQPMLECCDFKTQANGALFSDAKYDVDIDKDLCAVENRRTSIPRKKQYDLKATWTDTPDLEKCFRSFSPEELLEMATRSQTSEFASRRSMVGGDKYEPFDIRAWLRKRCARPTPMSPNSSTRLAWDIAGLVLISYDLITIPLAAAFEPPENHFTMFMDWVTRLFWTGDMAQAFFVGYYEKGQLVMNFRRIICHYMKTWFVVDLGVVGSDWLTVISKHNGHDAAGLSRVFRGSRAIRVLRLLRLLKLQRMFNMLYDMIENESTFLLVNLAKLLVFVLALNHAIACMWFLVGRHTQNNGERNWIEVGNVEGDIAYEYTTAMHWSLTQFTPASMDISARNTMERIYSIVVLFFAMVAFSSVVGSITASMTSIRNMKGDNMKQFWLLRRYLRQRQTPKSLTRRIIRYLEHQSQQPVLVQPQQVHILSKLSEQLQSELKFTMHSPHIMEHPFFRYLCTEMAYFTHRICSAALDLKPLAPEDIVFNAGDEAHSVIFIKDGGLCYVINQPISPPPQPKEWMAEPVLWTRWRHCGQMQAITPSEVLVLDPKATGSVMRLHPRPFFFAKKYAEQFVQFLNDMDPSNMSDLIRSDDFYEEAVEIAYAAEQNMDQNRTSTMSTMSQID